MPVCTKCSIDKPIDQYFKEVRKSNGRTYYKKYCNDCFRKQSRDWKLRTNYKSFQPKEKQLPAPAIEDNPNFKKCNTCNEYKLIKDNFYLSSNKTSYSGRCKSCNKIKEREYQRENKGYGERYRQYPNEYINKEQRDNVFKIMNAIGWSFIEKYQIWIKPPFKTILDGQPHFPNIIPKPTGRPRKEPIPTKTGRKNIISKYLMDNFHEIKKYRGDGLTFYEIGCIYNCSSTTIKKVVKKYHERRPY
jgi:hypothetical protein